MLTRRDDDLHKRGQAAVLDTHVYPTRRAQRLPRGWGDLSRSVGEAAGSGGSAAPRAAARCVRLGRVRRFAARSVTRRLGSAAAFVRVAFASFRAGMRGGVDFLQLANRDLGVDLRRF